MRASFNRFMLGVLGVCLIMTSVAQAQQEFSQPYYSDRGDTQGTTVQTDNYVPYAPQTIYTNTVQQVADPMAIAESGAAPQQYVQGTPGGYPVFYGDQFAYGYQPTYGNGPCPSSYQPGLTCGKWFFTAWLDQGFTYNTDKPDNKRNGPLKFNDRSNEYQMNQAYLSMGRNVATSGSCWDFGGRVDLLYGSDFYFTSAIGLETHTMSGASYQQDPTGLPSRWNKNEGSRYQNPLTGMGVSRFGLAMPQLYAEFYVPLHYGLSVKAGHFYSIMGYESVMSPQNFFYSHSYSMMYGQPMTHTGILFSQRLTHRLTGIFGVTRGWDTWEDPNGKLSYLAGVRWTSCDGRTEFSWVGETGNETVADSGNARANSREGAIRSHYSMVLSHQLTPRLKLVTQHDLGYENDAAFEMLDNTLSHVDGRWYSLSQYVFYQLTEKLTLGVRGEWFRDVNSSRIYRGGYPVRVINGGTLEEAIEGTDYSQVTVGLNWKPYECLVIRPEARWDWSGVSKVDYTGSGTSATGGMFNDFTKKSQTTLSLSAYVTY